MCRLILPGWGRGGCPYHNTYEPFDHGEHGAEPVYPPEFQCVDPEEANRLLWVEKNKSKDSKSKQQASISRPH